MYVLCYHNYFGADHGEAFDYPVKSNALNNLTRLNIVHQKFFTGIAREIIEMYCRRYILLFVSSDYRNHNFGDFGATTEIQRVRWHPGSTKDSHLLVLTSENSFR